MRIRQIESDDGLRSKFASKVRDNNPVVVRRVTTNLITSSLFFPRTFSNFEVELSSWELQTELLELHTIVISPPCLVNKTNKMLSYRRETALQGALQFSPKVEDWNWETIFYGH